MSDVDAETTLAIIQADAGADEDWKIAMGLCIEQVAKDHPYFTADTVFAFAETSGMTETTPDNRAFGPLILRSQKDGVCEPMPMLPCVPSIRRHKAPLRVWKSCIYKGPDLRDGMQFVLDELRRLGR